METIPAAPAETVSAAPVAVPDKGKAERTIPPEVLIPGEGNEPGSEPATWVPCGKADGVIFLGRLPGDDGYQRQALRYLRHFSGHAQSDAFVKKHRADAKGRVRKMMGITDHSSNAAFLIQAHPEILAAAEAADRKIEPWFAPTKAGRLINQPQYRNKWLVKNVEEGVWVVYFAG